MSAHASLQPMTPRVRTFFGCLTCRKRKVKCDSRQFKFPCGNCCRLNIPCTPSFHSNFKNSSTAAEVLNGNRESSSNVHEFHDNRNARSDKVPTPRGTARARRKQRQAVGEKDSAAYNGTGAALFPGGATIHPPQLFPAGDASTESLDLNSLDSFDKSFVPSMDNVPTWPTGQTPSIFSYDVDDVLYDIGFQQFQVDECSSSLIPNTRSQTQVFDTNSLGADADSQLFERNSWAVPSNAYHEQLGDDAYYGGNLLPTSILTMPGMNARRGNADYDRQTGGTIVDFPESVQSVDWGLPAEISQVSIGEGALVRHYESTMSTFLSIKSPQWNLYTYMLRSPQGASNSPLRNSILAWTSLHLSRQDENPLNSAVRYYDNASKGVNELLKELSAVVQGKDRLQMDSSISDILYMILSTTFFLTQCNLMICDLLAFSERLNALKDVLKRHWESLRGKLGSLSSRLLIWLAYLDLRASLWGEVNSNTRRIEPQSRLPALIDMLGDLNALPNLRAVSENQSYLSECFGDNYPTAELREDLVQEPVNAAEDDIMCVLSRVKAFEDWNDEMIRKNAYQTNAEAEELKANKVHALRTEIARIRAGCKPAVSDRLESKADVDRTSFHHITVSALHLSATIMLNRILEPDIRTDEESQSAAHEICKIAHQLKRTGCLRTPRSLIWPLPIFIAGIETTDAIHQDWILEYLGEMEDWGPNMRTMRTLLRKIILRQERERRRVKVRDVMQDFDLSLVL